MWLLRVTLNSAQSEWKLSEVTSNWLKFPGFLPRFNVLIPNSQSCMVDKKPRGGLYTLFKPRLLLGLCLFNYVQVILDPRFSAAAVSRFKPVLLLKSAFLFIIVFFIVQQLLARKGWFIWEYCRDTSILITPKSLIKEKNFPRHRSKALGLYFHSMIILELKE